MLTLAVAVVVSGLPLHPASAFPSPSLLRLAAAGPSSTPTSDYAQAMRAGDDAFRGREDPRRLAEAIARYAAAVEHRPGDQAALLALARAQAYRAQSSPAEAKDAWREASRAAERALRNASPAFAEGVDRGLDPARLTVKVDARGAAPLYWLALATMGMAQARGMVAVLAVKDVSRAMMERAAELDERIDFGGPRRALGAWLATIPSAAGGGARAARLELERARTLFPHYQLTRVRDAETLAVLLQDRARFDSALGEVLAFDEARAPEIAAENRLAKKLARELKSRRDKLF